MIRLLTLGQIELTTDDGGDTDALIAQPKRFALLCYLAIPKPGTLVRRDTLLGVFWPEGDTEHSRSSLRQALAHIRRALGEDVVVRRGGEEVGLNPDIFWCDVTAFEQALDDCRWADAIKLYRGELLKGLCLSNGPEFERWLDAERSRLAGRDAKALEELATAASAAGKTRAAVEWWQALTLHDPYDSRYAMGLMEALERADDPANALLFARKHEELLREDLEIGPPREFEELTDRLREAHSKPAAVEAHPNGTASPAVSRGRPMTRRLALPGIAVITVAVLLGSWIWLSGEASTDPSRPAVAVFRLQNLGPPNDSAFTLGVTDALVTRLSKIGDLRLSFANTSLNSSGASYAEIAEDFGSTHLISGTLLREPMSGSAGVARIYIQLIQTSDGTVIWADEYELESASLFQMYGDIGSQIARALDVTLLEREHRALAERPTQDDRAYEYFLIGNAFFEQGYPIRWELHKAVEMYEKAIEADSGFALAYAWLSMAHGGVFWGGLDQSAERAELQKSAAGIALRLDPDLPEGHLALGTYYYMVLSDHERALAEFDLARDRLEDDYWYIYSRARVEIRMGRFRDAAAGFAEASDLRPLAWSPALGAGQTYQVLREFEKAHQFLDRYMAIVPSRPYAYLRKALAHLEEDGNVARARQVLQSGPVQLPYDVMIAEAALDYCMPGWYRLLRVLCGDCRDAIGKMRTKEREFWHYYLGKALLHGLAGELDNQQLYNDSAATVLQQLIEARPGHGHYHSDLALAYAATGRREQAIQEAQQGVSLAPLSNDPWYNSDALRKLAEVYATFSESDSAVAALEILLEGYSTGQESGRYIRPRTAVPLMRIDPVWDPIRDHPGFQELLERFDPLKSASTNP